MGGDHPESDTSDFCNQDQIKQYQTIVGQLIWLSGLGRFDIAVHVMTMSRFRQQPRIGHLERLKKIVGYLANLPHGALRFRLHEPDYSNLPHKEYDWQRTVYRGAKEEIPHDIPEPKGKHVTTTTYVDANLHHDQVTGKAVTACLHMVNATPSHWHTKRQATVETATFGSEFVAARIATDQIIDLRYTLMYLGVPVRSKSYMFGDNKSVVDSASIPTSTLSKKSTLASYHRVREAIAAGYTNVSWSTSEIQKLHVWRQQVCGGECKHPYFHPIKEVNISIISQGERSYCCRIHPVQLEEWKIQPCTHLEQALGVCKYLATVETSSVLERRHK